MSYCDFITPPATYGKARAAMPPPEKSPPFKALIEYELLTHPPAPRDHWRASGRPCMRASPFTKTYGWHARYDASGKITLLDNAAAAAFIKTAGTQTRPAMRNRKARST